jgi:hypothetical protein
MKNIVFYLLLFLFIIFYLLFSLLGFLPLVAYSYGLLLINILKYLINIDRIFINIFTFFILKKSSSSFINHVLTTNFRKNKILLSILSSVISMFILYIIFRTFTTFLFYIINNFILNRTICRSIQISNRASHPILMTYMFVFLTLGLGKYLKDFGQNITTSFLSKDSMFLTLINGIGSSIDGFMNFILRTFVLSIPIIGTIIDMLYGYVNTYLVILEYISNLIPFNCGFEHTEKIKKIVMDIKTNKTKISNEIKKMLLDYTNDRGNIAYAHNEIDNINKSINNICNIILHFIGFFCLILKLLYYYKSFGIYMNGSQNIFNVLQRGFLAGAISLTVLLIILIMVIFFPSAFGG